jgi:Protein of unknown function (DUF3592)/Bacterial PH domain
LAPAAARRASVKIYRSNQRRILARYGAVGAILALWCLSPGRSLLPLTLLALVLLFAIWVVPRPRLSASDRGVTVANMFTTKRIPWAEVRGFGYGPHRGAWCVQIARTDGTVVSVEVLSNNIRAGGYSAEHTSETVSKLRATLQEKTGIHDSAGMIDLGNGRAVDAASLGGSALAIRRTRRELRVGLWTAIVCGLTFVAIGASMVANAAQRPHVYARLRKDGVLTTAQFEGCSPVDRFDNRDIVCRLSLTYLGRTRRWDYRDDYRQFDHLAIGDPVPVLVDPAHPTIVYTVHDVDSNDNAGVFSVVGIVGMAMIVLGLASLVFVMRMRRAHQRRWQKKATSAGIDVERAGSGRAIA